MSKSPILATSLSLLLVSCGFSADSKNSDAAPTVKSSRSAVSATLDGGRKINTQNAKYKIAAEKFVNSYVAEIAERLRSFGKIRRNEIPKDKRDTFDSHLEDHIKKMLSGRDQILNGMPIDNDSKIAPQAMWVIDQLLDDPDISSEQLSLVLWGDLTGHRDDGLYGLDL